MAKHVAYPCLVASFFFNFGGIDAKSSESSPQTFEESMATFRQSTINYDEYQDVSFGSESSYGLHDDEWLSSGTLSDTGSLSGSSSETCSYNDSNPDDPMGQKSEYVDRDPRSVLYAQHLQLWTDNIAQDEPQTAKEQTAVFEKSFPTGCTFKDVYRVVEAESGGNTHLFAPGITPVKRKIKGKIQSTPRRQDNRNRLSKGKSPIWVDPRDGEQGQCHMHHLGQLNSETFVIMLPVDIHRSKGMHTKHGPSSIDRPAFAKEKKSYPPGCC